jgi:hypothetical protein
MKRTIVVVATTLILTAGLAKADGLTPPRHVNGSSPGFHDIRCICTCLDGCCYTCFDYGPGGADNRPHEVSAALSYHPRELSVATIRPNTARPKTCGSAVVLSSHIASACSRP